MTLNELPMRLAHCGRCLMKVSATCLALACGTSSVANQQCKVEDITVDSVRADHGNVVTHIAGRIVNRCVVSTGVQLKFIFYGPGRSLLSAQDVWPASISNIPPGDYPFQFSVEKLEGLEHLEVRTLKVQRWAAQ